MANPNILTASSVVGVTTYKAPTDGRLKTRSTDTSSDYYTSNIVLYNPASSGKIFKITDIIINNNSNSNRTIGVVWVRYLDDPNNSRYSIASSVISTGTGRFFVIDSTNKVGAASSIFPVNNHFYLLENQGIEVSVSDGFSNDAYVAVIQYEEIS